MTHVFCLTHSAGLILISNSSKSTRQQKRKKENENEKAAREQVGWLYKSETGTEVQAASLPAARWAEARLPAAIQLPG